MLAAPAREPASLLPDRPPTARLGLRHLAIRRPGSASLRGLFALGFVVALGLAGLSTEALPKVLAPAPAVSTAVATPVVAPVIAEASEPAPTGTAAPIAIAGSVPSGSIVHATVVRVIDGRTILADIGGRQYTVQYLGISTPATVRRRATAANAALVAGREVTVEADVAGSDGDGRLLGYVWVKRASQWTFVNFELTRLGLATVAPRLAGVKYADAYLTAQAQARARHLGWWGQGSHAKHAKPAKPSKADKGHKPPKPDRSPKPARTPRPE